MNNIFTFATGELSQDAFICWCLNWINEPDNESTRRYRQLAYDLLSKLIENIPGDVELSQDNINSIEKVILVQQVLNIDVLAIIPQYKLAIIIEDKTSTSEHDNQISFYTDKLKAVFDTRSPWNAYNKIKKAFDTACVSIDGSNLANYHIHTVYFKTGYYFDYDWRVAHSDSVHNFVTGSIFWSILDKYSDCESDILTSYCVHLKQQLDWYQEASHFWKCYDAETYYIEWERIAQHGLLQNIFDGESSDGSWLWKDMSDYTHEYSTGTNQGGAPWTNRRFWSHRESVGIWDEPRTNHIPWIFWRVDHDKKGPYLSLRYYNNDNAPEAKTLRNAVYWKIRAIIDETVSDELRQLNTMYDDCISRPNHGNYYENTLIHIGIKSVLDTWTEDNGAEFIRLVRSINEKLRNAILAFDWNNAN